MSAGRCVWCRDKKEFNFVERRAHLVSSSSSWAWSGGKNFTANLRIVCFGPVRDRWVLWQHKIDQPMARSFRNCHNGNNGLLKRALSLWSSLLKEAIISINYFRQALIGFLNVMLWSIKILIRKQIWDHFCKVAPYFHCCWCIDVTFFSLTIFIISTDTTTSALPHILSVIYLLCDMLVRFSFLATNSN